MLPLTLLGLGAASVKDYANSKALLSDDAMLRRQGLPENYRKDIIEAAQRGDTATAQRLLQEGFRQRDPAIAAQSQREMDAETESDDTSPTASLPPGMKPLDVGGAAAHGKKMDPWDNNPNNQERTMPEAVEIFRNNFKEFMQLYGKKLGVNISPELIDQINFVPDSNIPAENGQRKWAAYKPNEVGTGIKGEHTWKDFLNNGKINVKLDPEVLKSDQAIVGIFAHELLELHGIQNMMKLNANRSLSKAKLQQLINDLHEQAINLQNKFVQFMKDKARKQ